VNVYAIEITAQDSLIPSYCLPSRLAEQVESRGLTGLPRSCSWTLTPPAWERMHCLDAMLIQPSVRRKPRLPAH
jgi:hypothetical protein